MDIMKKLGEQMDREFGKREPEPVDATPPHLRQLPADEVERVAGIIRSEYPHMPYTLGLELGAWVETGTVQDARRVANALRHAYGRPGLAQEIEGIIEGGAR